MTTSAEICSLGYERTFSIQGLSAREELLLKSMVRLLGGKTAHHWHYSAESDQLRVRGQGYGLSPSTRQHDVQQTLILGIATTPRQGMLNLPVLAHELQAELNRIGSLIKPAAPAASSLAAAAQASPNQNDQNPADASGVAGQKLRQWPAPELLAQTGRIRLATLLTSRYMTLEQLHRISGQPWDHCKSFLQDLGRAKLLISAVQTTTNTTPALHAKQPDKSAIRKPPPALGLLARIRMRLGLQASLNS
jgi:hypothetical protein